MTLLAIATGDAVRAVLRYVVTGPLQRAGLISGVLGALTTFSTFSYEATQMTRAGSWGPAILYVAASLVLGLGVVVTGLALGSRA